MFKRLHRQRHSLRVRLTAWYGLVMAALLLLFAGLLYVLLAAGLAGELDRTLQVRAANLASTLGSDEAGGRPKGVTRTSTSK